MFYVYNPRPELHDRLALTVLTQPNNLKCIECFTLFCVCVCACVCVFLFLTNPFFLLLTKLTVNTFLRELSFSFTFTSVVLYHHLESPFVFYPRCFTWDSR